MQTKFWDQFEHGFKKSAEVPSEKSSMIISGIPPDISPENSAETPPEIFPGITSKISHGIFWKPHRDNIESTLQRFLR